MDDTNLSALAEEFYKHGLKNNQPGDRSSEKEGEDHKLNMNRYDAVA